MAKANRYSRWRRLPGVFRFGEHKLPDPDAEPQRLTVYLAGRHLDNAELQAARAGVDTIQDYCADLLIRALDAERVREQVADVEARHGPLEGLHLIADDPEYLAELSEQAARRELREAAERAIEPIATEGPAISFHSHWHSLHELADEPVEWSTAGEVVTEKTRVAAMSLIREMEGPAQVSRSSEVVLRHAGQTDDDPNGFLPALRRGGPLNLDAVAELARALNDLERESRNAMFIDRRVAFALHRLAYEGQVLHTDAWPGTYDDWTIETLRAVQESVERILSGQDIRYYPTEPRPEYPH